MSAPYRVAETTFALLQFASIAMLSAGSLRLRHWLIVPLQKAYPAHSGFSDSSKGADPVAGRGSSFAPHRGS